ncbi:hypothetical protein Kpol_1043p45, partial [Vanderwaltozyma polyspora DSM 70294]
MQESLSSFDKETHSTGGLGDQDAQEEQMSWFKRVYSWIVVIDGDVDILRGRGYHYVPEVTNYMFFLGGRFRTVKTKKHLSLIVMFLIIAPMVLFSIFETHKLWHTKYGYKLLVIFF